MGKPVRRERATADEGTVSRMSEATVAIAEALGEWRTGAAQRETRPGGETTPLLALDAVRKASPVRRPELAA